LHRYDKRNKSYLLITSHNTKLFECSIAYSGMLINNRLSNEIKIVMCVMKFEKIVD
jgi:hypothetical protein